MTENEFRNILIKYYEQRHNKRAAIYRVETRDDDGFPDLLVVENNLTKFIELKIVKNVNQKPKFRKSQLHWHKAHADAGNYSFIKILDNETGNIYNFLGKFIFLISQNKLKDSLTHRSMSRDSIERIKHLLK